MRNISKLLYFINISLIIYVVTSLSIHAKVIDGPETEFGLLWFTFILIGICTLINICLHIHLARKACKARKANKALKQ